MSINLTLHVPFHPAEVEDLILTGLPAEIAPFLEEEHEGVLFRFQGELVDGHAIMSPWPWSEVVRGGEFSVPYSIVFGFRGPTYLGIPKVIGVTASILKAPQEGDLLLTHEGSPMLLRRDGVVTLSNGGYWTPAYLETLGIMGPLLPLWSGDPGWEEPSKNVG
jgi:hypothetical protein